MTDKAQRRPLFDPRIVRRAVRDSFVKLDPRQVARNPVMFVVEVGSVLTTLLLLRDLATGTTGHLLFTVQVTLWLWFTVLFANFAEAMAEGRGKAQADTLRKARKETSARKLRSWPVPEDVPFVANQEFIPASRLRKGDLVVVEAGQIIPGDGEIIQGIASVDEAAITGESAPVIR
ncbi:MAG: potassium-transporting ATPase subunit B, partial [Acidobacteriota bacterium]|nr:potassium-transporting ATPase subunit B [Acidobacteriota bacterium]